MSNKIFKYLDILFTKSESPQGLFALEKLFLIGIPFNKPHGIKFKKLTRHQSHLFLPNKKLNHNHLKGMHACAIATVGEFSAGLLLCKNFPTARYRIIMKSLHVDYHRQARSDLFSHALMTDEMIAEVKEEIAANDKGEIELKTLITNSNNEDIAQVTTVWQLKDWKKTHY